MNNKLYINKFTTWHATPDAPLPDVSFIPPLVRRRMTALEKIAVSMAHDIIPDTPNYRIVFASRFGEWEQTARLLQQFHDTGEMSPAGFSNSVHNASMGHLSLITKNKNSYTSIAAGDRTLEMGILDALMTTMPVLFIYTEEQTPKLYQSILPTDIPAHGFAIFIDNTGDTAIYVTPGTTDCEPLTAEKFCSFLGGTIDTITTTHWTLRK